MSNIITENKNVSKNIKLFLDDYRQPIDCLSYMHKRIGNLNPIYNENWKVVTNYSEFVKFVEENIGNIDYISFDHDLADAHYSTMQEEEIRYGLDEETPDREKTGWHCAKFLIDLYKEKKLTLPKIIVHSMNPVGSENITNLFIYNSRN